ncbi:PadR family transcriptional regulator [Micromonospora sp. NPDC006766]|uniref:PadR family transcriptional regulator n=1 Tax=Micromonospora sp. NPDC006766 TaxID=3154778 RepID=UPI0033D26EE2
MLRAPSYFVLAALLDGPLHGYVIIKRVGALSDNSVRLAAGTLYAILDRLAEAALIEVVKEEIVNGRARRCYALTPQGRATVLAEAGRLAAAATIVTDPALRQRALARTAMSLA